MKLVDGSCFELEKNVAPFTGAWIEITIAKTIKAYWVVAPFTGAWIEILNILNMGQVNNTVAPFTGAWIEIY